MVFNVHVNNQTAMDAFDISSKANPLGTAYFVDFITNVLMGSDRLLIQVGPSKLRSSLVNAVLNGLEMMKFSNHDHGLDGI
ncbi:hypothetical protein Scep_004474 [Stephania cephalantha]|uniref:Uncharacterized protein n=1 Tax=Stephania cephalantha TaxID=152367 RepID=A0AAP0PWP4_9MAGN